MKPEKYNCSLCNYESNKKYNFNRHMVAKHNNCDCKNLSLDDKK